LLPHPFFDGNDYWQRHLRAEGGGSPLIDYVLRGAGRFRTVQAHDPAARDAALRVAGALFQHGGGDQAATLLAVALHPPTASPHPSLVVEIRHIVTDPPVAALPVTMLPQRQVALTRPAVVAPGHVAPPPVRQDSAEVCAMLWSRALVIGGADGIGTRDGGWWPQGAETGPLPGSALARHGDWAMQPGTPLAARSADKALLRRYGPGLTYAEAIFACGSGSASLDRFLLEVLPRALLAARMAPPAVPVLTEADLPAQALQALRLALPGHPVLQLPRGCGAEVDRLYIAGMVNRLEEPLADPLAGAKLPVAALQIHPDSLPLLRTAFGDDPSPGTAPRLFLCPQRAPRRHLLNAQEMAAELARR
ncbi:MAG: hypothetical protein ACK4NH_15595, partial [Gemmobacter sp.]